MSINSKFYILSDNLLINSNINSLLYDGLKVHWQPDLGNHYISFNKGTEYTINFNTKQTFDFIRVFGIPTSGQSKWGTTLQYDNVNSTYWLPYFRIYYSIDNGTNWNIIDNNNAQSISHWFSPYSTGYQVYLGNNNYGWLNNSAFFYVLLLNSPIQNITNLKFVFDRDTTFLSDYKVAQFEVRLTKQFSAKEFEYTSERNILKNEFNDNIITIICDDVDYSIYNYCESGSSEIFGIVNSTYFSNYNIENLEINTVERKITLQIIPLFIKLYNRILDKNTPIINIKKDYYPYDIINLLYLQLNVPCYFFNIEGILSQTLYIPKKDNNILTELLDYIESNRSFGIYYDYKNNFIVFSKGYENLINYTKTSNNYIELPKQTDPFTYEYYNKQTIEFIQDLQDENLWDKIFTQNIFKNYIGKNIFKTKIERIYKRKTEKHVFGLVNTVDKGYEIKETKEYQTVEDVISNININMLEYQKVVPCDSLYYTDTKYIIKSNKIKATAITVPNINNPTNPSIMSCFIRLYPPAYTEEKNSRIKSIKFKYIDIRNEEVKGEIVLGKELTRVDNGVVTGNTYADVPYYYDETLVKTIVEIGLIIMNDTLFPYIYISGIRNSDGKTIWKQYKYFDIDPQYSHLFSSSVDNYNLGIGEFEIDMDTTVSTPYIRDILIRKILISGFDLKYGIDNFVGVQGLKDLSITEPHSEVITASSSITNVSAEVLYKLNKQYNPLSKNEYVFNKLNYPLETNTIKLAYIIKNNYPYFSGIRLNFIKQITGTLNNVISDTTSYIEKYSKNLEYAKSINQFDGEYIVTQLKINQSDLYDEFENQKIDFTINQNETVTENIPIQLFANDIVAYVVVRNIDKTRFYVLDINQQKNINDGVNNFNYLVQLRNSNIYINIKNLNTLVLDGNIFIYYRETKVNNIGIIETFNSNAIKYGFNEYDVNTSQLYTASQIFFLESFINNYNNKKMFTLKNITTEGDFGIMNRNMIIKIIDNYLGKKISIYPNRIVHRITEDLLFETDIEGKVMNEENI